MSVIRCFVAVVAMLAAAQGAAAATVTIDLVNLYSDANSVAIGDDGLDFAGNGYVTMNDDGFLQNFGYEHGGATTMLQADLSSVLGSTIASAYLNYELQDSGEDPAMLRISSFNSDGSLEYSYPSSPATVDLEDHSLAGSTGAYSRNITQLLIDWMQQSSGSWFGLYLQNLTASAPHLNVTGSDVDAAEVRLVITTTSAVPEPSSLALFGIGGMGVFAGVLRRKKSAFVND